MTNQTIDGVLVSRELLRRTRWELDAGTPSIATLAELRALLDAPAVQWLAMEVNGKPWVIKEGPNADKWRAMGYELFPVEPAAQPQGEPVAYLDLEKIQPAGMAYATKMRVNHRQTALYAEQPAPVAAVLPERKEIDKYGEFYDSGWNDCLDDLKRLNPSL